MNNLYKKPQIMNKKHWMDTATYDKEGRITYIEDFFVCQLYRYFEGKVEITTYTKWDGKLLKKGIYDE